MPLKHLVLLLATATSFASSILLNKLLVDDLPTFTLAAMRVLLAAPVAMAVLVALDRELPRAPADRRMVVLAGMCVIVVPYCALAWGQQHIASGLSGILYSTMPLFTLLVAHLVLPDEKLGWRKLAGIALGMAGVVTIIGPSALAGIGGHFVAELVTVCGPLFYAIGTVLMRRRRHVDPVALTAGMFIASAFVLVPIALAVDRPWRVRGGGELVALLFALSIVGTIVPAALNYLLVQRVGATRASLAMFLMPLIAVGLGAAFLDERLPANAFAGLLLIVGGSAAVLFAGAPAPASRGPANVGKGPESRDRDDDALAAVTAIAPSTTVIGAPRG